MPRPRGCGSSARRPLRAARAPGGTVRPRRSRRQASPPRTAGERVRRQRRGQRPRVGRPRRRRRRRRQESVRRPWIHGSAAAGSDRGGTRGSEGQGSRALLHWGGDHPSFAVSERPDSADPSGSVRGVRRPGGALRPDGPLGDRHRAGAVPGEVGGLRDRQPHRQVDAGAPVRADHHPEPGAG
ncbi:hypothetical protein ACFFX0_27790 [Citricoccus parietis]|uniref:Uncharacterized protein n=1 Tax=Citricoccus parietis TaxID=592307 RepID=A0ABV5G762_9MICC